MRRAAKRDDNEALIVRALGGAGWTVVRISDSGAPDLLCARMGELRLVEVKGPKGTLTPTQELAFERLNKAGVTVLVVRSPAEALGALGVPKTFDSDDVRRWVAVNGAFLCEQCWLPENGLHAKDCPTRQVLKVPGKVKSAYRAAKDAQDVLPKKKVLLRDDGHAPLCKNHGEDPTKCSMECYVARAEFTTAGGVHPLGYALMRPSRGVEGELQPLRMGVATRDGKCDCFKRPGRVCGACRPGIVLGPATSQR